MRQYIRVGILFISVLISQDGVSQDKSTGLIYWNPFPVPLDITAGSKTVTQEIERFKMQETKALDAENAHLHEILRSYLKSKENPSIQEDNQAWLRTDVLVPSHILSVNEYDQLQPETAFPLGNTITIGHDEYQIFLWCPFGVIDLWMAKKENRQYKEWRLTELEIPLLDDWGDVGSTVKVVVDSDRLRLKSSIYSDNSTNSQQTIFGLSGEVFLKSPASFNSLTRLGYYLKSIDHTRKENTGLAKPVEVESICVLSDVFSDINTNGISDVLEKQLQVFSNPKSIHMVEFSKGSSITLIENLEIDSSNFGGIITEVIDFIHFMYPDRVLVISCPIPGQYRGTSPVIVAPKPGCTLHFCAFGDLEEATDHQNGSVNVRIADYSYFGTRVRSKTYMMGFKKQDSEFSLSTIGLVR